MKAKIVGVVVLVLHVIVLAGFSLMQGCTTGTAPVSWLNWPWDVNSCRMCDEPEPVMFPSDNPYAEPVILPPVSTMQSSPGYVSEPYVAPAPSSGSQIYTVKKGDTLSAIASMYGTSWKKLAEYNSLSNPNRLVVGQEIRIPAEYGAPVEPVNRPAAPASSYSAPARGPIKQGSSYVIQRGDTLGSIAKRSGLTVAEIQAANGLSSSRIIAGKSLTIPRKGEVKAPKTVKPVRSAPMAVASPAPLAEPAPVVDAAPVTSSSTAPVYEHVLYPGETIEDVARQYGSTAQEIMTLNSISDASSVKPGTKLLVPMPE